ncbi:hypothetical protein QTP70_009379 [Hemibagrus guttatus]|uniref:Integrase catalytic domain-containing protein n=1 Tax=Hemibagrus guttatus TaxID=175788 RepID=A0AAE0Q9B3_9TELE|nr:hypothetical protein QTP70_009379 [Hemibagrus guttatus]
MAPQIAATGSYANHQLYARAEKCEFHKNSITFLGYLISQQEVELDPKKVTVVMDWPKPTTIKELQQFLGFANYRRFIRNYSSIASPLTSLLRGKPRQCNGPNRRTKNGNADVLSQRHDPTSAPAQPEPILPPLVVLALIRWNLGEEIQQAQTRTSRQLPAGLLEPLPEDFVTDLPSSGGHNTILITIDHFSKVPLSGLPMAMETGTTLFHQVFRTYGLPEDIVLDRGPHLMSRVWKAFCTLLGINVSLSSGYHLQSKRQTKRLNQEIGQYLRSYCSREQQHWSKFLLWVEYAQNSLTHPSTGLTPFQCILGYQLPLFLWSGEPSNMLAVVKTGSITTGRSGTVPMFICRGPQRASGSRQTTHIPGYR